MCAWKMLFVAGDQLLYFEFDYHNIGEIESQWYRMIHTIRIEISMICAVDLQFKKNQSLSH